MNERSAARIEGGPWCRRPTCGSPHPGREGLGVRGKRHMPCPRLHPTRRLTAPPSPSRGGEVLRVKAGRQRTMSGRDEERVSGSGFDAQTTPHAVYCSPPPRGEGLGVGGTQHTRCLPLHPTPDPSPSRGGEVLRVKAGEQRTMSGHDEGRAPEKTLRAPRRHHRPCAGDPIVRVRQAYDLASQTQSWEALLDCRDKPGNDDGRGHGPYDIRRRAGLPIVSTDVIAGARA